MRDETKPDNIKVIWKGCNGCMIHKRDVLVTYMDEDKDFIDIFITNEQAEKLAQDLLDTVKFNKEEEI